MSGSGIVRRDISPFLKNIRAFLLGRTHTVALRFEDAVADRTTPPPELPEGPAHKLAANYYCLRDGRREAAPPIDVTQAKLIEPIKGEPATPPKPKLPTPGAIYKWD